ncbi:MAG: RNA-binding protein [Spirochaetia bacterium]|jgi:RNA recognition motif-containing protein|uniref:Putative RNA-binding protein RbpE n=1 Tax=uncultured spirochete TaxID=156406 RepID=A0A3P3XGK3_9SPIR|nr:RNA-binding protein [Rectinema subterraneum]MDQ7797165.1 RNA-binding protein [Spirochaetia bacterium]SLM11190.1 putative RNA-binding protein RbpE [uncultured spirochete]HBE46753.1 RNA-binding protein [Spirochaetaceae bacterium]HCX96498.1 RNA-binding protein [Spirochaetaceae bacterium]
MAKKIYVGNMNYNTSERQLQDLFAQYGEVSTVNIIVDRFTGKAKGFGFVEMENAEAADAAIAALNGQEFMGRQLRVNEAQEKPRYEKEDAGYRSRRY